MIDAGRRAIRSTTYGVLAADQLFVYALETQTLSLHPALLFDAAPHGLQGYEPIMVHELAHQWFGDSVAPVRWQDVWLNEGHADYYQQVYAERVLLRRDYTSTTGMTPTSAANQLRHDFGPVAKPTGNDIFTLFSDNVYSGGSLVAVRAAAGGRREHVQRDRADLGPALQGRVGQH